MNSYDEVKFVATFVNIFKLQKDAKEYISL